MRKSEKPEQINVWRFEGLPELELRSGVAVTAPYPRHWHEEYQFCLIQAGGGELFYRGIHHKTPRASLFIVHPGEVHSNQTTTGCSFRSIYVTSQFLKNIISNGNRENVSSPFFPDPMIFDLELIKLYQLLHVSANEAALERDFLLTEFLTRLTSRYAQTTVAMDHAGKEDKTVEAVRDYIFEYHDRNISLKELASLTGLSPFHLTRVFTKRIGMPPHAFQTQVRVSEAKKLLRSGVPLANVAATTGFADQSHFIRHFKRLMKITPGEYLRSARTFNTQLS